MGKDNFQGKSVFPSQQEENPPFPVFTGSLTRQKNTPGPEYTSFWGEVPFSNRLLSVLNNISYNC